MTCNISLHEEQFKKQEEFMIEEKTVFKGSPSAVVNFGTFALCALISIGAVAIMIFSRKQLSDSPPLRYGVWALL
ncbi:MAG: hypothetical protein ACR2H1_08865, partial [Limisphaerales bacterium]